MKEKVEGLKWAIWKAYIFGSLILTLASIQIIGILFTIFPLIALLITVVVIINSIIVYKVV